MATEEQRKKEVFLQDVRLGNPACLAVWQEFGYSASRPYCLDSSLTYSPHAALENLA
jgi:hypothetical protein